MMNSLVMDVIDRSRSIESTKSRFVHGHFVIYVVHGQLASVPRRESKDPDAVRFGIIVRGLREKHGWTRDEMAERAGMNASYLGFIERGENVPTLTIIILIAETLEIDAGSLVREVVKSRSITPWLSPSTRS
jgi:DNA-binding XRE family transcriptional regulator